LAVRERWIRILVIVVIIVDILGLYFFTPSKMRYEHAVYRMFFYLPLVIASFWFGLKGAVWVSGSVVLFYIVYSIDQWKAFSYSFFETALEMTIYLAVGLIIGFLVERERKEHWTLLRAESLAAVGRTVLEVAHDMKTPLIAIGGLVTQVSRKMGLADPDRKKLDLVIQETMRLESMTKEMLDFGGVLELQPKEADLNEIVKDSVEMTEAIAAKAGVELKVDLFPSLPPLLLDGPRVKEILLNLITNAVQASPTGERVLVKTALERNAVLLKVSDRGCGIMGKDQENVFAPFFSTKKSGTGLGLAIVKKFVEAHGGEVSFQPNPEGGVTFIVRLPLKTVRRASLG
jgi:two-component system sensor histidine kinase HydH